ncbi:MAG: RIO1 family regulatory kinase/ATPase [bacterium]
MRIKMDLESVKRENLHPLDNIYPGKGTQADIWLSKINNQLVAVKDYHSRRFLFKLLFGRWLIEREFGIYKKLQGINGVPKVYKLLDKDAFILEYIDGKDCSNFDKGSLPEEFFTYLRSLIDDIHARGVVHCDLKKRTNIIITQRHQPYLVDFAAAFTKGRRFNFIRNWFYKQFYQDDLNAIAKLKKKLSPQLLTQEEEDNLSKRLFLEKEVRVIRKYVRRWIKKLALR